jgi:restriction system protein
VQGLLVQCKHWNAKQVPHNAVHELLGITVNEGATGAILVTSGEFTRYAREVAARGGRVQLVDGDALRDMLGPLPDVPNPVPDPRSRAETVAAYVGERLLLAAEDRIRRRRRGEGPGRRAVEVTVIGFVLKAGLLVLVAWGIHAIMDGALKQAIRAPGARPQASAPSTVAPTAAMTAALPSRQVAAAPTEPYPCHEIIDWRSGTYIDHCAKPALREPTAAEIRESQRKADEAAAILAPHTPEI